MYKVINYAPTKVSMEKDLINYSMGELLEKFGAGNHKPGAGSAAVLQAMTSAQLIRTVISLSLEEKRRHIYGEWHHDFYRIDAEIRKEIYPRLVSLFHEDSIQFDVVFRSRVARDKETDLDRKDLLSENAISELKRATELPIQIANFSLRLAEFGIFILEFGFSSARGDSGVALNSALSAVGGCIAIIDLNLQQFGEDDWSRGVEDGVMNLRNEYKNTYSEAQDKLKQLKLERDQKIALFKSVREICSNVTEESKLSNGEIEDVARRI